MELKEPSLEAIKQEAAAYEAATVNRQTIEAKGPQGGLAGAAAHAVQPGQGAPTGLNRNRKAASTIPKQMQGRCLRCGGDSHMAAACPVSRNKAKCGFCKKEGHLEAACFGKYRKENARALVADGGEVAGACWRACAEEVEHVSATCWLAGMNEQNASCRPTPRMRLNVAPTAQGAPFQCDAIPDTGATCTIVAEDLLSRHGIKYIAGGAGNLTVANGEIVSLLGTVWLRLTMEQGHTVEVKARVCAAMTGVMLVSWHALIDLVSSVRTSPGQ